MVMTVEKLEKALRLKVKGRLDAITAPDFEKECAAWIDRGENQFIVDLEELEYISSAGLRSVLITAKRLKSDNGRICFCNTRGMVRKVFNISGFQSMFPMYDTLDEALTRF
ncbi:MAG: STAS domain-containing protein [Syntrophobacteraceae bacterium]|nr:STAS domain-containing protein [Syntrophobacteraceae bacterium]